ncbi:Cyclic nucleotide-binding domain-containing protein, DUF4388 [Desulfonema limicola]|uniref:Cyclic nucleotide-binding domain-containing protein, DUF4388 n=1 Tax=Desulfonema limicola TaxID=45656 RepID=A0A975B9Y9_9BACT|nr:DUF4388 domain-containing protein [Desulfonema limicola]QTA81245.1 Cyclic nucleotide-binding domain-containing protein, DUF4388 [Desulfonema limicola]
MTTKIDLSGSLNFLGLGDVLQLIGSNGSTGILRLTSKYSQEPGYIYFQKGNIINGSSPSLTGLDAVYAMFGWTEGEFEFTEQEIQVEKIITDSRMGIILDGLRMVDDGKTKKLGPVEYEEKSPGSEPSIPIIKGSLVDYMYVLDEETFSKGHNIVQENKHGSWIWVILEGVTDVIKATPKGPLTIIKLGTGSFIGGITSFSFMGNIRTATVQAAQDVQLGVMDSQRLAEEYGNLSKDFRNFAVSLDRRLNEITERAVDAYLGRDKLKSFTKYKNKNNLPLTNLYKINQGEACIVLKSKTGYLPVAEFGENDFIGHIPFLDFGHEPENAAVFISEDFQFDQINADDFQQEYDSLSTTLRNILEGYANCISITTKIAFDFQAKHTKK